MFLLPALAAALLSCQDPAGPGDDEIRGVTAGFGFSCALVGESAHCWGRNDFAQLGRGSTGDDAGPGPVTGGHRFKLLSASDRSVCGVTTDDQVMCWGQGRIAGSTQPLTSPTLIEGTFPASITSIGVGWSHGCVLGATGVATCFGTNSLAELGNGTQQPSTGALGATPVTGGHTFSQLSVGIFHSCGVESGDVWCWGSNFALALGPGAADGAAYATPRLAPLSFDVVRVEAGSAFTCVLDTAVKASCWGNNLTGQLGRGEDVVAASADPALVTGVSTYVSLAAPRLNSTIAHMCGLAPGGGAVCWGLNDSSQLGRTATEQCAVDTGSRSCSRTPAAVTSSLAFKQLSAGRDHTCGVTEDAAEVYCWGSDTRKQLGGTVGGTSATAVKVILR